MRLAAVVLAAASLAGGSVAAAERHTDMDYLMASRCRGLADLDQSKIDTPALDAFLKAEGRSRMAVVIERGASEMARGKRDAKTDSASRRAQLEAELTGPCQRFKA